MKKNCIQCGKEYLATRCDSKYCSRSCKLRHRKQKNMATTICLHCGKLFLSYSKHPNRFCSLSCATTHVRVLKTLVCIDCGRLFVFSGRTRKLRCDLCFRKARSLSVMRSRAKRDPSVRIGVGSGNHQHIDNTVYNNTTRLLLNNTRRLRRKAAACSCTNYRKLVMTGNDNCSICGYNKRQDILVVHHKNMNRSDNSLSNLVVLCPNCHAAVHADLLKHIKSGEPFDINTVFLLTKRFV